jgi:DNA helicase-2/ATP-dependent DNA helicase PcrA
VHRLAFLLTEQKISRKNIVVMTFTNKAANELKQRIADMVGDPAPGEQQLICGLISI